MKKYMFTIAALSAAMFANGQESDWQSIGMGAYQPGLLDYYENEYTEVVPAEVLEDKANEGTYKFIPQAPTGALMPVEVIVHAQDPEKVWCENAYFFIGIMNYSAIHKVTETEPPFGADDANYGSMKDGAITFPANSFLAMEFSGYKVTNTEGNFALYLPGSSPVDDPIVYDTWNVIGKGKYVEGLLDCEYKAGVNWTVDIEQSEEHPGCYRLKPYYEGNPSCPYLPEIADTYIYIHAEDPDKVYTSDVVFLNAKGVGYKIEHRAVSADESEYYGKLVNGVITFPAESHTATVIGIPGAGTMPTNTKGKACVALPGSDFKDYYIHAEHSTCALQDGEGFCKFPITLTGGADVMQAALVVEAGHKELEDIDVEKYIQGQYDAYPSMFFGMQFNLIFPMAAEQFGTNRWTMILIAVDNKGKAHDVELTTFFTPEKDKNWEDYAEAEFTDLLVGPVYLAYNPTYTVKVQKKKGTTGKLRLVNPYLDNPEISEESLEDHAAHNHYIYINAEDPDFVYIEEAPTGVDMGYGDIVASSEVGAELNNGLTIEEAKGFGLPAGMLKDDKISFPNGALRIFEPNYKDCELQPAGTGVLLHITKYLSGINDVQSDSNIPARYYDLRGFEIEKPAPGTICVKVQGGTATKFIAR